MDLNKRKELKTKKPVSIANRLLSLAVRTGLEPATPCVTGTYSNQLNYRTEYSVKERLLVFGSANLIKISFIQNLFAIFLNFRTNKFFFTYSEATVKAPLRLVKQRTNNMAIFNFL